MTKMTSIAIVFGLVLVGLFSRMDCDDHTRLPLLVSASVGWDNCTEHFMDGFHPSFLNNSIPVCRSGYYAVSYDPEMQNPSWTAYYTTKNDTAAKISGRVDYFQKDPDLTALGVTHPSHSNDIFGSTWNRGHLAPSAILSYSNASKESTYVTSNIAPQWGQFNQQSWRDLEEEVFDYINSWTDGSRGLHIITGVGYTNRALVRQHNTTDGVTIPSYYFKALCDPLYNESVAFIGRNEQDAGGILWTYRSVDAVAQTAFCSATLNATRGTSNNDVFSLFPERCRTFRVNESHWNFRPYTSKGVTRTYTKSLTHSFSSNCSSESATTTVAPTSQPPSSTTATPSTPSSTASPSSGSPPTTTTPSPPSVVGNTDSPASTSPGTAFSSSNVGSGPSGVSSLSGSGTVNEDKSLSSKSAGSSGNSASSSQGGGVPSPPPRGNGNGTYNKDLGILATYHILRVTGQHWRTLLDAEDVDRVRVTSIIEATERDILFLLSLFNFTLTRHWHLQVSVSAVRAGSLITHFNVTANARDISGISDAEAEADRILLRQLVNSALSSSTAMYPAMANVYTTEAVALEAIQNRSQIDSVLTLSVQTDVGATVAADGDATTVGADSTSHKVGSCSGLCIGFIVLALVGVIVAVITMVTMCCCNPGSSDDRKASSSSSSSKKNAKSKSQDQKEKGCSSNEPIDRPNEAPYREGDVVDDEGGEESYGQYDEAAEDGEA